MNESFDDRRRASEEDYFRRQNIEAIERIQRRAAQEEARQRLSEATGATDEDSLNRMQNAGIAPETLPLLALLPLVETAWAEGRVQGAERKAILDVAGRRGIGSTHEAYPVLTKWLAERPSDEFFESARGAFAGMLSNLPPAKRAEEATEIVAACVRVARASGGLGFLDLGRRISDEEHLVLERIINQLAEEGISPEAAAVSGRRQ